MHVAHASVHHWLAAGKEINHLRGLVLLANVYAAAELPEGAVRYAEQALAQSEAAGETQSAFDRATTLACAARAHASAKNNSRARQFLTLAQQAAAKLDADDRTVFDRLCPKPSC